MVVEKAQFKVVCSAGCVPGYCPNPQPHRRVLASDTSNLNYWELPVYYGTGAGDNCPKPVRGLEWGGEAVRPL